MKKLKLDLQGLNAETLKRDQLKQIVGGSGSGGDGCCCEHRVVNGFDWYNCGLTKAEAIAAAAASGGKWCCDSCPSTFDPCTP